jgi:ABC-type methionine transport system permease subunit
MNKLIYILFIFIFILFTSYGQEKLLIKANNNIFESQFDKASEFLDKYVKKEGITVATKLLEIKKDFYKNNSIQEIENCESGPIEAMEATGARNIHVIWHAVVPQVLMPFLSFTIFRWDINIRMATIIGLVGGGGVGTLLMQYQGLAQWNEVGTIVIVIAVVVWMMDFLSGKVREALL